MSQRGLPGMVVVLGVIVIFTVVPALTASDQWLLMPHWSDVTPGRVTVEPWGVGSGENAGVSVVTEDRRLRVMSSDGTEVAAVRTGLREPVGVLPEGSDYVLLVPPHGTHATFVRIDLYDVLPRVVGRPTSVESVIPGDARFVVVDGESLVYAVSPTGLVTHAGITTGVLWERRLPAPPTATIAYRGAVYVALEDGRVFRFDGNGTGIELFRLSDPVVAMTGVDTSSPALLTIDRGGVLSLVNITRDGRSTGRSNAVGVKWQARIAASDTSGGTSVYLDVTPPRGRFESWYAVIAHRPGGITVVNSEGGIQAGPLLTDMPIDGIVTGRLPSGGFLARSDRYLFLVSEDGTILDQDDLRQIPATATWIDEIDRLILTYPDWSIEAWTVVPTAVHTSPAELEWSRPVLSERRDTHSVRPGALSARAEAVFAGTSKTERSALLKEIQGQRRRAVLFDRVGEVRSILRKLVRETLETPEVREGRVRNDFPEIRRAAVEELGHYMDRTSRKVLTEVVRHDPDYRVVAAALHSFARYGVDDTGVTSHAVARFRTADDRGRGSLAPAMIDLLELTSARLRHPAAAEEALDLLIESNLSRDIRRRAATIERESYR